MSKHQQLSFELIEFEGDDTRVPLSLDSIHETIWASAEDMAGLFGKDVSHIGQHIKAIFREGELDEATCIKKFPRETKDGSTYKVYHYNLDVIISVGYRVSSKRATKFRKWANNVLKQYILDGYVLNEARLAEDPHALSGLAADVRRLRSGEKQIYEAVRDAFKVSASDYDPQSKYTRHFYAQLQDKFLYAITGQTSAEVILDRADHSKEFMGLNSTKTGTPTVTDVKVGKNYLITDELYALHLLCEQFLIFIETRAVQGHELRMADLSAKFDALLEAQGHPVFPGYKEKLRAKAESHAKSELEAFKQKERIKQQNRQK